MILSDHSSDYTHYDMTTHINTNLTTQDQGGSDIPALPFPPPGLTELPPRQSKTLAQQRRRKRKRNQNVQSQTALRQLWKTRQRQHLERMSEHAKTERLVALTKWGRTYNARWKQLFRLHLNTLGDVAAAKKKANAETPRLAPRTYFVDDAAVKIIQRENRLQAVFAHEQQKRYKARRYALVNTLQCRDKDPQGVSIAQRLVDTHATQKSTTPLAYIYMPSVQSEVLRMPAHRLQQLLNAESERIALITALDATMQHNLQTCMQINKREELAALGLVDLHTLASILWCSTDAVALSQLEPELIFMRTGLPGYTPELAKTAKLLLALTTAHRDGKSPGVRFNVLVRDRATKRILGFLKFSQRVPNMGIRDHKYGLTAQQTLHSVLNLSVCVPVQPFGFNMCGGKLLAMLAFSKEVVEFYTQAYGYQLAAIETTSLYGKSIQYDRLPCLKMLGKTKGYGSMHVPTSLYKRICTYLKAHGTDTTHYSRMHLLRRVSGLLGRPTPRDYARHGFPRGYYFGTTATNSIAYLQSNEEERAVNNMILDNANLKTVQAWTTYWRQRWAQRRLTQLCKTKRLKTHPELFDPQTIKQNKTLQHTSISL